MENNMQLQGAPVATIATTTVSEKAVCDTQGLTTITAVIRVKLCVADAVFVRDGRYTDSHRTEQGTTRVTTRVNMDNILGRCSYAFDDDKPPTISDNKREIEVNYELRACRYPDRTSFTERLDEAAARLRARIEKIYQDSLSY